MSVFNKDFLNDCIIKNGIFSCMIGDSDKIRCQTIDNKNAECIIESKGLYSDTSDKIKITFNTPIINKDIYRFLESFPFNEALRNLDIKSIEFNKGVDEVLRKNRSKILASKR